MIYTGAVAELGRTAMTVMTAGTAVGALLGLAHAAYVFRTVTNGVTSDVSTNHLRAIYFAVWTFGLWVLFGPYVLVLWMVGVLLYLIFKAFR
jgi:hypothetical protein